ncbi:hypothetical protein EN836_30215 [Mesorhizobium sp. M1C.F.Ca.ET.193.01.1.1]|nr:MAG: hypothetical protein EOQ28_24725 [Mesorhizobium sp.]TGQ50171.1 hypothetical protein EN853_30205 [Mesorhizobium sp. M1C.F.Ca.ET.210.01.1.1]TGQ64860.1 hypothetical protein EN855_030220 [Mesorhizobium sp. M1C.F.Ca.ET.212.01.1.1]TGQ98641.1 hypothetical protein EN847_30205 [Mesorhizobium sp. M1C.F.Ca.ET.204.01.1.1]TGR18878.1 hypothetical protein EN839_30205 [Mesorhizobium sp. M1C.F.Ca.ET.196.01.1.1]TGR41470.1 hypothetical protein EN838_30210 [Mesorhizobium sp. M1C.F.Ca.ET.195.01.1.1]TGR610
MSRNSYPHLACCVVGQSLGAKTTEIVEASIIEHAAKLYGSDAPTAVAFCALEAWFENKKDEYSFWLRIFRRLRN